MELNIGHWTFENFEERFTAKEWRKMLLAGDDKIIFKGRCRQLVATNLGVGVYSISKKPLK